MTRLTVSVLNGIPVAGDFNPDHAGDEVGLYTATTDASLGSVWYFDGGNYDLGSGNNDFSFASVLHGVPFAGDFDNNGEFDIGVWSDDTFFVDLAPLNNVIVEFRFGFIGVREEPVIADMDQDGYDDFGLWVPDRSGVTSRRGRRVLLPRFRRRERVGTDRLQ